MIEQKNNTTNDIFVKTLMVIGTVLLFFIFVRLIDLWLLTLLAFVAALFLSFFVDYFHRRLRVSRPVGLIITLFILLLLVTLFALTLVPIIVSQGRIVLSQLPNLAAQMQKTVNSLLERIGSSAYLDIDSIAMQFFSQTSDVISKALSLVGAGIQGILQFIVLLVIALYFAMRPLDDPKPLLRWFPIGMRPRAEFIIGRIIKKLRSWLLGQLFSMMVIAIFYSVGLAIIGVPNALFFGILAGILCFIPYLGPPASTLGPLMFALVDSPMKALWVMVLYIGSQTVESYFLTPMVMRRQVKLHPVATILSIMAMGELFGILGIAVAVPVVATLQFLAEELYLKEITESPPR